MITSVLDLNGERIYIDTEKYLAECAARSENESNIILTRRELTTKLIDKSSIREYRGSGRAVAVESDNNADPPFPSASAAAAWMRDRGYPNAQSSGILYAIDARSLTYGRRWRAI